VTATVTTAWPGERLRELLAGPAILDQPAVCDPLGARLAAEAGYAAVTLGGYAIGAHLPLTSALSLEDIARAAAAVVRACGLPVLLDADIGWGATGDIPAAVTRLEAAGLAAVTVTSQYLPDRAPFSEASVRVRARAELLDRVRAARAASGRLLIMTRCDVPEGDGYPAAAGQVAHLLTAGADAVLVHAPADELGRLAADLPGSALIYAGSPGPGPAVPAGQLQRWGYRGLSLQYHRCYCARRRLAAFTPGSPARDSPGLPGLTADLERKQ
jgi:2-methylisocitrate lyase-like PEP mutase family enzyme